MSAPVCVNAKKLAALAAPLSHQNKTIFHFTLNRDTTNHKQISILKMLSLKHHFKRLVI